MYNVKDLPAGLGLSNAFGDGEHDDSTRLQAMINASLSPLYFPPSRYLLENTLTFPERTGYHVIGSGLARPLLDGSPGQGAESVLVWGGGTDEPMIEYKGTGLVWSGLNLWGRNLPGGGSSSSATRASYGIRLCNPPGGIGTGKVWFDSLLIADCDEAIRTSFDSGVCIAGNDDTLAFGYFWCEDCTVALHLVHSQSMMYTFQYIHSEGVSTIFLVDDAHNIGTLNAGGGGAIYTQAVSVRNSSTVLDVQEGARNNAHYDIGGIIIAPEATNVYLLKNDTSSTGSTGDQTFRFRDGHFRNNVFIDVDRTNEDPDSLSSVVELLGCRGVGPALNGKITINGRSANPSRLIVRDCEVDDVAALIDDGNSEHYEYDGVGNWTFEDGFVGDEQYPG